MQDLSNLVVYNDGELELKVSVDSETIWLTQLQMSQLFDTSTDNVGLHLKNIYLEKELDENSTTEFFSVVRKEGNRLVKRELKHYNLNMLSREDKLKKELETAEKTIDARYQQLSLQFLFHLN